LRHENKIHFRLEKLGAGGEKEEMKGNGRNNDRSVVYFDSVCNLYSVVIFES
jgi:hypothetical protein